MKKDEKNYLVTKMTGAANAAKNDFANAHPTKWTEEEVRAKLVDAGFVVVADKRYSFVSGYVTPPLTQTMLDNEVKYKDFCAKVDSARQDAIDAVYLGGEDALTHLRNFKDALAALAQA